MRESFWWWQCSDRYIISLSPPPYPIPPILPVPNKPYGFCGRHHVYLLTQTFNPGRESVRLVKGEVQIWYRSSLYSLYAWRELEYKKMGKREEEAETEGQSLRKWGGRNQNAQSWHSEEEQWSKNDCWRSKTRSKHINNVQKNAFY